MNFRRALRRDEPEINFIPLIDVLLVVLIFLLVTTTFSKFTELQVNLPAAGADRAEQRPREIVVAVATDGRTLIDNRPVAFASPGAFAAELRRAASGQTEPTLVIYADAGATHQSVIDVLEAARLAGLARVTFAAQAPGTAAR
ncbi:MAG: biopolymer transporter ExbD [Burkholderiaceae bacterium]|nr:biopolymer transporter ExbD [Burkholderiaceae bacterium]